MQKKLKIPVLTSTYPSSQIWSRFDYSTLPNFGNLEYRVPFFGLYQVNKYEYMQHTNAMKKIVGAQNHGLVDDWDQDHAMILGQGTRAGLYQAIMMKPSNVKYVYPMTTGRSDVQLPSTLSKAIVVFNVEADRHDDMAGCPEARAKLMKEIADTAAKGLGVVVLAPPSAAEEVKSAAGDKVTLIETTSPHSLQLVRGKGTEELPMYWVGSCTQNNFISGIGEHKAMMVGYAKRSDKTDQSTQKYNCHKIAEFQVGLQVSKLDGLAGSISELTDLSDPLVADSFEKVQFYSEILQEERRSKMDLEYWIDYVKEFGVAHKIPLYDHMSFVKYNNLDVWGLVFLAIYIPFNIIYYLCACCCCKKKQDKVKAE